MSILDLICWLQKLRFYGILKFIWYSSTLKVEVMLLRNVGLSPNYTTL
jgi:hypothetical protein